MLYQQVANEISTQIKNGLYQTGEKLPGVRKLGELFGVSVSTIVQAHQLLESQGLIQARARSGYYISHRPTLEPPSISEPDNIPQLVTGQALVLNLVKATNRPSLLQLGAAVPHSSYLPLKSVQQSIRHVSRQGSLADEQEILDYVFPPGNLKLRQQIAKRMMLARCTCHADDIVITNGCQEALNIAFRSVVSPGGIIAIESPVFYGLLQVIESLGMRALEIPTDPVQGISLDALDKAINKWPIQAVAVVPNFSNPLGYCMSDKNKKALVSLLAKHKIPLVEDDVYGDLGFLNQTKQTRPRALKSYDKTNSVIYCASYSKSIAPGLRTGWIIPGKYFAQTEYNKYVTNLATPGLQQMAIADFLGKGSYDRYLRRVRGQYQTQVARVTHCIGQYFPDDTKITQPLGGFVIWIELPMGIDSMALHKAALKKNISIAPGPIFSASGRFKNCIRISCAQPWDKRMENGLKALGKLVARLG